MPHALFIGERHAQIANKKKKSRKKILRIIQILNNPIVDGFERVTYRVKQRVEKKYRKE